MNKYKEAIEYDEKRREIEEKAREGEKIHKLISSYPVEIREFLQKCRFAENLWNWVLTKDDAINFLSILKKHSYVILGVDIILKKDDIYGSDNGTSWNYEPSSGNYSNESCELAEKYIIKLNDIYSKNKRININDVYYLFVYTTTESFIRKYK